MKVSFSLPPKSKSTVRPISDINAADKEGPLKEFVTKFDPSETITNAKPKYVIPPLQGRKLQFEADIPSAVSDNVTYGLNLRHRVPRTEPVEQRLLKRFRSLPDAPELEDYERVPVEGYGAAILAGYGWKPGQGVGRGAEKDNKGGYEGIGFKESDRKIAKVDVGKEVSSNPNRQVGLNFKNLENVDKYRTGARAKDNALWLRSHIRVRIISKDYKGGRFYLKKGVVADMVGPRICDITIDETQGLLQGIHQDLLETALPRRGGPVLVLSGRHKGVYGSLVEKDSTGVVVCDADSQEMLRVKLDQVAEYMADPADVGY